MNLTSSQVAALSHIREYARTRKDNALSSIRHILSMCNIGQETYETAIASLRENARIALHFHPDRIDFKMKSVAEDLFESGIYKSQFETQLSNGSVSAQPGGERDLWEQKIFGGKYTFEKAQSHERPKYGALDLLRHADGPAPRFGSCYFLLNPSVLSRSTFTYLDSHYDPLEKGTLDELDDIIAALLSEIFTRDFAIGEGDLNVAQLMDRLKALKAPYENPSSRPPKRNLNHYIEAQVHGEVRIDHDVEILVADPSFKKQKTGDLFRAIAKKYQIQLLWHQGFRLRASEVPSDFRGAAMPSLANRIAVEGYIDPSIIGIAAELLKRNAAKFSDRGNYKDVLQELKLMWHILVRYGEPIP